MLNNNESFDSPAKIKREVPSSARFPIEVDSVELRPPENPSSNIRNADELRRH